MREKGKFNVQNGDDHAQNGTDKEPCFDIMSVGEKEIIKINIGGGKDFVLSK